MHAPLIHARWRRPVIGAIAFGAAVVAALSILVFHTSTNGFDSWVTNELAAHLGQSWRSALFDLVTPAISLWLMVAVAVLAALTRRWSVAVLAIAGPTLSLAVTELVLKPGIGREHYGAFAFPSGHETGLSSVALVLLLAVCQLPIRAWARAAVALVLAGWVVLGALGLVRNFAHYATDTIGAVGVSTAIVLATALTIDKWLRPKVKGQETASMKVPAGTVN